MISAVDKTDAGNYTCYVSNIAATKSVSVSLTVAGEWFFVVIVTHLPVVRTAPVVVKAFSQRLDCLLPDALYFLSIALRLDTHSCHGPAPAKWAHYACTHAVSTNSPRRCYFQPVDHRNKSGDVLEKFPLGSKFRPALQCLQCIVSGDIAEVTCVSVCVLCPRSAAEDHARSTQSQWSGGRQRHPAVSRDRCAVPGHGHLVDQRRTSRRRMLTLLPLLNCHQGLVYDWSGIFTPPPPSHSILQEFGTYYNQVLTRVLSLYG